MANKLFIILGIALVGALAAFMVVQHDSGNDTALYMSNLDIQNYDELQTRMNLFRDWRMKYNKMYSGIEGPLRFKVWNDNYEMVQEHNAKNLSWELEMNQFADLTNEEFVALYTGFNYEAHLNRGEHPVDVGLDLNEPVPNAVDWRTKGAVGIVLNQGSCGACWSFSAAGALEGIYKIKKGVLKRLSKQQQVDCSSSYGNQGCNGGLMVNAFRYTKDKGIESDTDYPYRGAGSTCRYDSSKVRFRNTGYSEVSVSASALRTAVNRQPIAVGVQAAGTMQMYKGGILSSNCGAQLDHAILVVGYATSGSTEYWIVKNSWGTTWGEKGYIRIQTGSQNGGKGLCGINSAASYPTL